MADITISCVECGSDFAFTDRDQAFYAERGMSQPKRCRNCRQARKQSGGGGGGGFSGGGGGGDRQRFTITCSQCGREDTVPFKPSGNRPVLCRSCFSASRR